ncbi:MAG: survival protein SurE [Acidimicrobiia bacterium]|nr:survival protein SurE [Acidimicrobiia bacterium]
MNLSKRVIQFLALAVVAALLSAACGNDDDGSGDSSVGQPTQAAESTEAPRETATPEAPAATEAPAPTEAPEPTPEAPAATEAPAPTEAPEPTAAPTPTPTPTPPPPPPVQILVTNDDGIDSDGINLVVEALISIDNVEVTVVAPATNQSGTSNRVSDPAPTTATETATASGYPALAVEGTPADSVNYALDFVFAEPPDLVVSGSNDGQNFGPFSEISGTVGAARTAARRGVPAFAISQGGVTVDAEHESGIPFMVEWLNENLDDVLAFEGDVAPVWSLNTPSCGGVGEVRGLIHTIIAAEFERGVDMFAADCSSTLEDFDNDVAAFLNGYATMTMIPEELILTPPPS